MGLVGLSGSSAPMVDSNGDGTNYNVVEVVAGGVVVTPAQDGVPITGQALESGGSHVLGWLSSIRKAITDRLAVLGQAAMAGSAPVVIASDQSAVASKAADGVNVVEGATTDAAVVTDANGTLSAKLRGLIKLITTSAAVGCSWALDLNSGPTYALKWSNTMPADAEADGQIHFQVGGLGSVRYYVRHLLYNGTTWDLKRGAKALVAGLTAGIDIAHVALTDDSNGTFASVGGKACFRYRVVSATNTQQQVVIDLLNLHDTLGISMVCSAGTAALTVEISSDNSNWITVDSIAAAGTTIKQYTPTTVGATVALSPLSFRYVRITAATAGGGNTTTLTIGAK